MKEPPTLQERFGTLLRTSKVAIALEIIVVFAPFYTGLMIHERLGLDHISLGNGIVLFGSPVAYLGWVISLLLLWFVSKLRGVGWGDFGLTRPKSWFRTVLLGLGVALAIFGAVVLVINPIKNIIPNLEPRDMSLFNSLQGNLPNLLINMVIMWINAGFIEELLWRGYLMNRLIDLQGKQTKLAWLIALVGSAVIFGIAHTYQGLIGIIHVGAIGFVFGLCYLAVGRNLWPLIFAHALIDSLDFVGHYFGG